MTLIDLDTLKAHLRVLHDDEDAEIELYGAAAEAIVIEHLDRVVVAADATLPAEGEEGYDPNAIKVTKPIIAAILLEAISGVKSAVDAMTLRIDRVVEGQPKSRTTRAS